MSPTALDTLRGLKLVLDNAIDTIAREWESDRQPSSLADPSPSPAQGEAALPTKTVYEASKLAIGAAGMLQALLKDPRDHLMEVASQYFEARALHAASLARIPDIIHEHQGNSNGLTVAELAAKSGYEPTKCARIMRQLATNHIFTQTAADRFANNRTSAALIKNPALCNYIDLYGSEWYASSQHLVAALQDPSLALESAAFCRDTIYNSNKKTYWAYNDENPERHDMFATAMSGSAQTNVHALLSDYPWESLGKATIVDVGGGVGTLSLPLLQRYPSLSVVIQDRASVIEQARQHWSKHDTVLPRATFQPSDFFQNNTVMGAEVYMLRYIMDDWPDEECIKILGAIRHAMNEKSRVLIVEALLVPAWFEESNGGLEARVPSPLLPNCGVAQRFVHCRDMNMMSLINGQERTVAEMSSVVERAGLRVSKIHSCRGAMSITECVLP